VDVHYTYKEKSCCIFIQLYYFAIFIKVIGCHTR
jgi:hypothetical protein